MAAGVDRPFAAVLAPWVEAEHRYQLALKLSADAETTMAIRTNVARLYNLLGDLLKTLKGYDRGEGAARAAARTWAELALEMPAEKAPSKSRVMLEGMTNELLAQLAFRSEDIEACKTSLARAQAKYLDAGFLAGIENLERMAALTAVAPAEQLKHYKVSLLISESLRQRLPEDRVGATQAGFFARKAWVLDKMVELLLKEGKPAHALRLAEQSRARALQDLLLTSKETSSDFLGNWPKDAAGLEYFLSGEHAYVFLVTRQGEVKALPLVGSNGKPLRSQDLIADVHRVLVNMEAQAAKMYQRLSAGRGFDHAWQDDLHRLFGALIPKVAWEEVSAAKTTVIVPQHILHYFPFSALVTERDERKLTRRDMPMPHFWIEKTGERVQSPSLTIWHALRQGPATPVEQISVVGLVQAPGADALPGVEKDLKNLRDVFDAASRRPVRYIEGARATPARTLDLLKDPGLVFVATHGFNDADRPLQSFLLLLADQGEGNGRLSAEALFRQKIAADVVVMSACYSGLGDRSPLPGDDLFGLQRAMLQSGARAVIAGLWDVYDDTAPTLMRGFFDRFAKGESVAAALQNSQRAFLTGLRGSGKTEPWIHPYFWAVYNVTGDDRVTFAAKGTRR